MAIEQWFLRTRYRSSDQLRFSLSLTRIVRARRKSLDANSFSDILPPTFKTMVYGLILGTVSCFQGMRTRGGTEGVGRSATSSVVLSSLFIILADVVLVRFILVFFPT